MKINDNWFVKRFKRTENFLETSYKCARNTFIKTTRKRITLTDNKDYLEFISCSYLGLHNDKEIINAIKNSTDLDLQGFLFSSSRTRAVSQLENSVLEKLSKIFYPYIPLLFQNLHTAHLGVIPLLVSQIFPKMRTDKKIQCILDKHSHQSLKILQGIIKQFCDIDVLDTSNIYELDLYMKKINLDDKTPFIIMDSVGSMGKIYPIKDIVKLVEKYNGYVYFDDAHGMSITGKHGSGHVMQELNYKLNNRVFISTSLTKGFGGQGGIILMPYIEQIDFLLQYCTTYTFSGPLSIPTLEVINKSCDIHLSKKIDLLQQKLRNNLEYFDHQITNVKLNKLRNSFLPFRIIYIGNEGDAIKYYKILKTSGILVTCAVYPVVEKSQAILRITFSATHELDEIKLLAENLKKYLKEL
ncbi:aminotransferase class I/II-fold pyridoxal phosphate-dependent enzyme [Francisella philomiragia]|uniref:aminotransferase class I/II-fold pyridoxal phosphate-dependent enzyme n=1 Tax=Francisella philomiragia TaxID=28110 RepID=UPI001903DB95|nr:aminotransferase class I/II-fold pyridoxal phosphate-dependent enzyme [Francisella philomiragia]MBK2295760.1 aminotransferase class I/II-fold pyridoxal phosphate-dependent enzyme [Francisella philomiragia]MBK2340357.1 aminotransferase class I/II-fold pyridoxal phosphate-dependent enzyme [Francisella philomiragia]